MKYMATVTGNLLVYRPNMFYWQGESFPGLVDEEANALYDHPGDSFNERVGIPTALDQGLIVPVIENNATLDDITWTGRVKQKVKEAIDSIVDKIDGEKLQVSPRKFLEERSAMLCN